MHWHPNADEWLYIIERQAEVTVFDTLPNAVTRNFNPGGIDQKVIAVPIKLNFPR